MKQRKAKTTKQTEQALERENNVRATTIKQLIGLSVSKISAEILGKAVTNVQVASARKEQAYKCFQEAKLADLDYKSQKKLLSDLEDSEAEYDVACYFFTTTVLGQVFTWLEGAGK